MSYSGDALSLNIIGMERMLVVKQCYAKKGNSPSVVFRDENTTM